MEIIKQKKWIGGNRDASSVSSARRSLILQGEARASVLLSGTTNLNNRTIGGFGRTLKSASISVDNSVRQARQSARNGGSVVPKKVAARNGSISGEVSDMTTFNGLGQKWYSNVNGSSWTAIACSSDGLYAVAGSLAQGQLVVSKNANITFTHRIFEGTAITDLACDGGFSNIIGGNSVSGHTIISNDGGYIWKSVFFGGSVVGCDRNTGQVMITGDSRGVLCSRNAGVSWYATNAPFYNWSDVAVSFAGDTMFMTSSESGIWKSADYGMTWVCCNSSDKNWQTVCCISDGTKIIACAELDGIYQSIDGGATWNLLGSYPALDWNRIRCDAGMNIFAVSSMDGLYQSLSPFANIERQNPPYAVLFSGVAVSNDASFVYTVSPGLGILVFK